MLGDYINTCTICGREFHTTTGKRLMCSDCIRAENERVERDALAKIAAKRAKTRATRKASGLSIQEIVRLAADKHMSYGEYVSRFGGA